MPHMYLPDVGEGLTEAELAEWLVSPGDVVELNQTVCEIETAKSRVELPAPHAGVVSSLAVEEGEDVEVGAVLMTIGEDAAPAPETTADTSGTETAAQAPQDLPSQQDTPPATPDAPTPQQEQDAAEDKVEVLVGYGPSAPERRAGPRSPARSQSPAVVTPAGERTEAIPGVRVLAKQLGIDLAQVTPAELGTRVTYLDLVRHRESAASPSTDLTTVTPSRGVEPTRTPIKGVRKVTAQAVAESAFTAPHVTEFITIDVTELLEMVARLKTSPRFEGLRVTPLLIAARAVCVALRDLPQANAKWDEAHQEIVQYPHVNLGIAAATDRGLIVPNIKAADTLGLRGLSAAMGDLVSTARSGKTTLADMSEGTFTITNVGVFGVEGATPILNRGEAAILALGATLRRPWVVDGEILPRSVMTLSLSFDHRLIDGELGSHLLTRIGDILTHPTEELATS